jgi:protein involved in ribonucleotide reduction
MIGNMKTAQQELSMVSKKKKPAVPKMLISFYNQSEKKRKLTGKIDSGSNCQTSAST